MATLRVHAQAQAMIRSSYYDLIRGTSGLIRYWRLDEPSGTIARELVQRTNDTINGTPLYRQKNLIQGDTNPSMDFVRANSAYVGGQLLSFSSQPTGSIEAWIWVRSFQEVSPFISTIAGAESANAFLLRLGDAATDPRRVQFVVGAGAKLDSITKLNAGQIYHIVATHDGTTSQEMRIYINGVLDNSTAKTGNIGSNSGVNIAMSNGGRYFDGLIDEVAIYDVELTAAQIKAHWDAGRPLFDTHFAKLGAAPTRPAAIQLADIDYVGQGYGQAQAFILTNRQAYGQAQAKIRAFNVNAHAQAQADIRQTYWAHAQAQAKITAIGYGFGQAQGTIKQVYQAYAQAQADIKTTYRGFGQAQASIKTIYQGYAQAQARIHSPSCIALVRHEAMPAKMILGQARPAAVVFTCSAVGQAQAYIIAFRLVHGQAQATIKAVGHAYGQAQADIRQTYRVHAQAQADILQTYRGHGQAQALISTAAFAFGQAQAKIKAAGRGYGQAQADIKAISRAFGQAQAQIVRFRAGFGQAQAYIFRLTRPKKPILMQPVSVFKNGLKETSLHSLEDASWEMMPDGRTVHWYGDLDDSDKIIIERDE